MAKTSSNTKDSLYTVRQTTPGDSVYEVLKFNRDFDLEGTYHISDLPGGSMICSCFAGHRSTCRHRQMLRKFQAEDYVNKGYFFNYDRNQWIPPSNPEDDHE